MLAVLEEVPAIAVDYLEVRDAMLGPVPAEGIARMLVAARLGSTRLLDNIAIDIGATAGIDGRTTAFTAAGLCTAAAPQGPHERVASRTDRRAGPVQRSPGLAA